MKIQKIAIFNFDQTLTFWPRTLKFWKITLTFDQNSKFYQDFVINKKNYKLITINFDQNLKFHHNLDQDSKSCGKNGKQKKYENFGQTKI